MTPKQSAPQTTVTGVYITRKTAKTAKTGSTYYLFDSSIGSLVCFDEDLAANIEQSDEIAYSFRVSEPTGTFKWKQIRAINGQEKKPMPKPAAPATPPPAPEQRSYTPKSYGNSADKSSVFEEKDHRISKLSVFSSVVNLMAAKAKSDIDFAKKTIEDMLLDAVTYANMVTEEFIYGVPRPSIPGDGSRPSPTETAVPPSPQTAAPQASTPAPVVNEQPRTTYTPPPAVPQATQYVPPPQPAMPTPAPVAPVAVTPAPTQMQAAAQKLFGAGSDLEAKMSERLRMLESKAQR